MKRTVRGNKKKWRIYLNLNDVTKKKNVHRLALYKANKDGLETIKSVPNGTIKIFGRTSSRQLMRYRNYIFKEIVSEAEKAIGNRKDALSWLGAKQQALDNQVPRHLLSTEKGIQSVIDLLGRINYGVYS